MFLLNSWVFIYIIAEALFSIQTFLIFLTVDSIECMENSKLAFSLPIVIFIVIKWFFNVEFELMLLFFFFTPDINATDEPHSLEAPGSPSWFCKVRVDLILFACFVFAVYNDNRNCYNRNVAILSKVLLTWIFGVWDVWG